jgi:hypothetical protein
MIMDHLHIFCAYQNGDFPVRYFDITRGSVFGVVKKRERDDHQSRLCDNAFQGDRSLHAYFCVDSSRLPKPNAR